VGPGLVLDDAAHRLDLVVREVGAVALALDVQALFEGVDHFVITYAKLFG